MRKSMFHMSAAMALAILATSPLSAAKLRLPAPTAPKDRIYSPGAIAQDLEKRGYRIDKMRRKGTTYSITATGPKGNKVQLTVDGRSGDIVGLAVLQAAANLAAAIAAIVKSGKGTRYVDDWHPFGIIVPDIYQTRWTVITTDVWTNYSVEYVTESWSGAGYRFAVPYSTIRPGHDGYSITTLEVSELSEPVFDVYDYNGTEITTEYSEESVEMSEASEFETTYAAENAQLGADYLGGEVGDDDMDLAEIGDMDVSDVDESTDEADAGEADAPDDDDDVADTAADTSDEGQEDMAADVDDDEIVSDEPDDSGDDSADEPDDDSGDFDDAGDDYDDGGDDGGDDYADDGGDEPDL